MSDLVDVDERNRRDPVLLEVIKHELASAMESVAAVVVKTGRSPMLRAGDFSAVVADASGRVVGIGRAAAFQIGVWAVVMDHVVAKWGERLQPDDILLTNDPYGGMGHLPDVALIAPVFVDGDLIAYVLVYSHHTDIGGRFAGGFSSQSGEIYEEGFRLPTVKLVERGVRNDALLETVLANVRGPELWLGDVEAKLTGCWRGKQEIMAILRRYGRSAFDACCQYADEYSELMTRKAISAIPDGDYAEEGIFEDDGLGNSEPPQRIRVTLRVRGSDIEVDFSGTSQQAAAAINMPFGMTSGMTTGAVRVLVSNDILTNSGFLRPITVTAPLNTIVNPAFPGAVGGRASLAFRVADVVFRALAKAVPGTVPVIGEGGDMLHFTGIDPAIPFMGMDHLFGGWGGGPKKDGIDGCAPVTFGSMGSMPVEVIEHEYPLLVTGFGLLPDTGGPGTHRGSLAVFREWEFLAPTHVMVRTNSLTAGAGLQGGLAGHSSANIHTHDGRVVTLPLQTHVHAEMAPGDRLFHSTGGSGGYGHPFARPSGLVAADVRAGKLTADAARSTYGVVIDSESGDVDLEATAAERASVRSDRAN